MLSSSFAGALCRVLPVVDFDGEGGGAQRAEHDRDQSHKAKASG
jgi:hypothetical protein